eukprot:365668-Chlamydomonas_euryale.AAC.1
MHAHAPHTQRTRGPRHARAHNRAGQLCRGGGGAGDAAVDGRRRVADWCAVRAATAHAWRSAACRACPVVQPTSAKYPAVMRGAF